MLKSPRYDGWMRSYGQFCGLAKALDAVGDRWSLLIVRELLLQGPCRYTDLLRGLPGIATNLLAERLRHLEEVGVVAREDARPPVATPLYRLTARGEGLVPVVGALGRWGGSMLMEASDGDAFRTYWMALPVELYCRDASPDLPPVEIEVRTGDEPIVLRTEDGRIRFRRGRAQRPDAVLAGPPRLVIGVLTGMLGLPEAAAAGLAVEGEVTVLDRVTT